MEQWIKLLGFIPNSDKDKGEYQKREDIKRTEVESERPGDHKWVYHKIYKKT
jgi:hypothetical protein